MPITDNTLDTVLLQNVSESSILKVCFHEAFVFLKVLETTKEKKIWEIMSWVKGVSNNVFCDIENFVTKKINIRTIDWWTFQIFEDFLETAEWTRVFVTCCENKNMFTFMKE